MGSGGPAPEEGSAVREDLLPGEQPHPLGSHLLRNTNGTDHPACIAHGTLLIPNNSRNARAAILLRRERHAVRLSRYRSRKKTSGRYSWGTDGSLPAKDRSPCGRGAQGGGSRAGTTPFFTIPIQTRRHRGGWAGPPTIAVGRPGGRRANGMPPSRRAPEDAPRDPAVSRLHMAWRRVCACRSGGPEAAPPTHLRPPCTET